MSCEQHHGGNCPECQMNRIEALLERIAEAVAPTEEQAAMRAEHQQALRSHSIVARYTNAIGGPMTGRGVR